MLRMDQVHVIRHAVLKQGRSRRSVALDGVSRNTVRKYLEESEPRFSAPVGRRQPAADRDPIGVAHRLPGGRGADPLPPRLPRRTAARNLIRANVPERVAMLLTGHKSRAIFDRYNIIHEQELLDAGDQLVEYLAQQAQAVPARRRSHAAG